MNLFDLMDKIAAGLPECIARSKPAGMSLSCDGSGLGGALILDCNAKPIARVRFPIQPETATILEREYDVLTTLGNLDSHLSTRASIPLGLVNFDVGPFAYYSYIPGRMVKSSDFFDDEFNQLVVKWLAGMHSCQRNRRILDADLFAKWVEVPAKAAIAKSDCGPSDRLALDECLVIASGIIGQSVPTGITHGDLWCGNALRGRDDFGFYAIDWSMAAMDGLPLFDLLYWHAYNTGLWQSISINAALRLCIEHDGASRDLFLRSIMAYFTQMDWMPSKMASWLVAFVINAYSVRAVQSGSAFIPACKFRWVLDLHNVAKLGDLLDRCLGTNIDVTFDEQTVN